MKIGGWEISKTKGKPEEARSITIGPSTSIGLPYGGMSTSLSSEMAMKLSAVYRCVDVRSDSIATMPYDVFVKKGDEWIKSDNHFSYSILNSQPNPSCSAFTFFKTLISQHDLNGNGYARIYRDYKGDPLELELLTGSVTMYLRPNRTVYYTYMHPYTNESIFIDGEDMIHIKNFSYDGLLGVSTLTHASNITGLAASSDGQAKGFFASGANASGIISVPGKISPDKAAELKAAWGAALAYSDTTGMAGGVAVLEGGAEFKPVTVNPRDAQMLETRAFNVLDVCRFFGVSPIKAFDVSSATYANVESYQLGYITDTATPLSIKVDNEFNRKLFRPSQRNKVKVEKRLKYLLSADLDTQANYYSKMFQLGTYSPNMICKEINIPGSPEGDKRYVQVNLTELGKEPEPVQNKNTDFVKPNKNDTES
jgi:HK97 family phage portal protein